MKDETHEKDNQISDFDYRNYGNALADNNLFKSGLGAFLSWLKDVGVEFKGRAFLNRIGLWLPIIYGIGIFIGFDFTLGHNIIIWVFSCIILLIFNIVILLHFMPKDDGKTFFSWAMIYRIVQFSFVFVLGVLVAHLRVGLLDTHFIKGQVKIKSIRGQIINIDNNYNELPRLTIKLDGLNGDYSNNIPKKIRINLKSDNGFKIGDYINCSDGVLLPPSPPIIPDAYDFARRMWFKGIGAVGSCKEITKLNYNAKGLHYEIETYINKIRKYASYKLSIGEIGGGRGLLTALVTGDRSYISNIDNENMQISGLGHIVSISGLHVALVSGIIFLFISKFLALSEQIALRYDIRKVAAFLSIFFALFYVGFTGLETPAVRAFLMSFLVLGAIIFDRKAINMRGLAMAALIILSFFPESVFDAGFIMSFLATMALIALWERADWMKIYSEAHITGRIIGWIIGAILVSFVAGLATTPIVLNNFGRMNVYSVFSNLLAAPINDFIIGPFAILGAFFSIFNIGDIFWSIAAWGCDLILKIAEFTAKLPFANKNFNRINDFATFIFFLSICWFCLFNSKIRYFSVAGIFAGLIIYFLQPKPVLLIAHDGKAMIAVDEKYSGYYYACYAKSGQFYARQALNYAPFNDDMKRDIQDDIKKRYVNMCRLRSGDWEAHYINYQKNNPILSLTYNNKTYGFYNGNLPNGAILQRHGWQLEIYKPQLRDTPWSNQQSNLP